MNHKYFRTPQGDQFIIDNFQTIMSYSEMAKELNVPTHTISKWIDQLRGEGKIKGYKLIENRKCFGNGKDPAANKKPNKTSFKKGNIPASAKKEGAIWERMENDQLFYYIKPKGFRKRVYLHRYLMSQKIGRELTKNDIVRFKDGRTSNCSIENLILLTRKEHVQINSRKAKSERKESNKRKKIIKKAAKKAKIKDIYKPVESEQEKDYQIIPRSEDGKIIISEIDIF